MKLSRKDFQALQKAADVADAQRRLLTPSPREAGFRDAVIGTAAGLSLLLLTTLAVQSLIEQDRNTNVTAGEQIVWNDANPAPVIR
jgi:hypothetical protein